jgi:hypothetical protein
MKDQLSTRGPGQGPRIATAAYSSGAESMNAQPSGRGSPRAPRMHSIPLPGEQEGDQQHLSYDGPALGCGLRLTGTLDGVPKVLSLLDLALPEPPFTEETTNTSIQSCLDACTWKLLEFMTARHVGC